MSTPNTEAIRSRIACFRKIAGEIATQTVRHYDEPSVINELCDLATELVEQADRDAQRADCNANHCSMLRWAIIGMLQTSEPDIHGVNPGFQQARYVAREALEHTSK